MPPIPGVRSPLLWGTATHIEELFKGATAISYTPGISRFAIDRREHWVDVFRSYYGPVHKAFAALDPDRQAALEADLLALLRRENRAGETGLVIPAEYLETVIVR